MQVGRNDWNSKLVNFFLNNNRLVILLLLGIIIGGFFALFSLRKEGFPDVMPKVVSVSTVYPGASAKEVEIQVTKIIEDSVKDVNQVQEISSTSTTGFSNIVIRLEQTADIELAVQNLRNRIASVAGDLPPEAKEPKVETLSAFGPDFIVGVSGSGNFTNIVLQSEKIKDDLEGVEGVKEVKNTIEQEKRLIIYYNPKLLAEIGLSPNQIEQILAANNVDFPLLRLDIDEKSQTILAKGSFQSISDLENQIIGKTPQNKPLRLKDVAQIKQDYKEVEKIQRIGIFEDEKLRTKEAVLLAINTSANADILKVKKKIDEKITYLKEKNKNNNSLDLVFLFDSSERTRSQVEELVSGAIGNTQTFYLLGGIQLVLLAMLLFVNWRAAIVASAAIPISFFFTLFWLYLIRVQLNTIVLFSLILVLGLIVDPAIVVLESIQRYKNLGYSGREAVIQTGRRYGSGLFIAVLTSIIVFVPFGIVSGIFGEIIKYIPITVVPALIASYFVPLALLPALAARFLKGKGKKRKPSLDENEEIWQAAKLMMKFNFWVLESNLRKIAILVLMIVLIILSALFVVSGAIPVVQFSSPSDNEALLVTAAFPKGMTFTEKNKIANQIETKINDRLGIKNYFYLKQQQDVLTIFITLQKHRSSENSSKKIISRLNSAFSDIDQVKLTTSEVTIGPPESEYQIQVQLFTDDLSVMEKAAKEVRNFLKEKKEVEKVEDPFEGKLNPQILITFDKDKLIRSGLTVLEVDLAIKSYLEEKKITRFTNPEKGESIEIFLQPEKTFLPATKQEIKDLILFSKIGQSFKLAEVARIEEIQTLDVIERFNGKRFVNVKARLKDRSRLIAVQSELDRYLNREKLDSLGIDSTGNQGEFNELAKSFQELFIALAAAVFLTYLVMVIQFSSFSQPLIMLFTIPLAAVGVFPALFLVKGQLGFLEILGFTILVGIVENVAIFLIDYANQMVREKNMSLKEAIIAATGVRFRPIILTKLVALGGLLPLAIFSPFWRGLSAVIIGGILVSGLLSMTVIPIFYTWFGAVRTRVQRLFY